MTKRRELTISVEAFIQRIAWLEFNGRHIDANALRDLANWFEPPFRVDEEAVRAQVEELQRQADKPPLWD